jgi:ABC-2 type transport system permease protein
MGILRQIKFEIRNILKSKFLLIMAILIVAVGIAVPAIGYLTGRSNNGGGIIEPTYRPPIVYDVENSKGDIWVPPGKEGYESIIVDGVTIYSDNPFYWNLQSLLYDRDNFEKNSGIFKFPASQDLMLELIELEIDYYLAFAQNIMVYYDYRTELAWRGSDSLYDKFFYEKYEEGASVLAEVAMYRRGMDETAIRAKYIDITAEKRLAAIDAADENLQMLQDIVLNNNFPKYISLRIQLENDQIKSIRENIAIQEQAIIDNPTQEEYLSQYIEELKRQIVMIETNNIPMLEYRLAKNIIPGLPIWQNTAISEIENSRNQLAYLVIMSEEQWNENRGGGGIKAEYGGFYPYPGSQETYQEYVAYMQRQIDNLNKTIIIAQKSLDSDKPDMKYVPEGSRNRTVNFLEYSMIVTLFGVLLGGWLIASEYQQGTIRLLMIRPKTRTKILLSKFAAALVIWLVVDLACSLANFIANGIFFGFADFANPNYTVTGQTGFLAYYIPRLLACILPILFSFTIAFMMSVLVKNIAVAIAVPIVLYIASIIVMNIFAYSNTMDWLAWTPIPFLQMAQFFNQYSPIQYVIQRGVNLSLPFGIILLFALSVVFTTIAAVVFKKRDIVN